MAAPTNLSFETADTGQPGGAAAWTATPTVAYESFADFNTAPDVEPFERFSIGWDVEDYLTAFASTDTTRATFEASTIPEQFENFEEGWSNDAFEFELTAATAGVFDDPAAPRAFEDFETRWDNTPYLTAFTGGDLTAAAFDTAPEAFEDFEEDWWFGGTYLTSFAGGDVTAADFDGSAPETYENFEEVRFDTTVSADTAANTLNAPAHPFLYGDAVTISSSAEVPEPLQKLRVYFVVGVATNTFQLAATSGGAAIDLTTPGSGTLVVHGDPAQYWTQRMSTV